MRVIAVEDTFESTPLVRAMPTGHPGPEFFKIGAACALVDREHIAAAYVTERACLQTMINLK